jgi:hypothetical protein
VTGIVLILVGNFFMLQGKRKNPFLKLIFYSNKKLIV